MLYSNAKGLCSKQKKRPQRKSKDIVNKIAIEKQGAFCNKRNPEYMLKRRYYENILREEFAKKGGRIERNAPQYTVIGECDFLNSWYVNSTYIRIDIDDFDKSTLSFTYGDSHPTFSDLVNDGKEYRKKFYVKQLDKFISD